MIERDRLEVIRRRHGAYASWAVWAPCLGAPKSNMANMDVFDERLNPELLETLNPGVVMVGLNVASRSLSEEPFRNFHDRDPRANDFKIRFAVSATDFWGAYMTDVIKDFPETQSGRLAQYIRAHPEVVPGHINRLRAELADLGHPAPMILAFGSATYGLLHGHLRSDEYSLLVRLTHYSHYVSKEVYRETVREQIAEARRGFA